MPESILVAERLVKVYGSGRTAVRAVDGVDIEVRRGELVLVNGPSGSGKTTLLSMLGGLLRPTSGRVLLAGEDLTALDERRLPSLRANRVGFVFQAFNLLSSLTVEENVLFPATLLAAPDLGAARRRASTLLERLGLGPRRAFRPRDLSGGEKQRVAIARALMNDPPVILADEPTGNLDAKRGQEVVMILHDVVRDEGKAVLMVTHDPRVEEVADRILWLEDGAIRDRKAEAHPWARDPVCGMRVDVWTATILLEDEAGQLVFCSERCRERYREDPERYARTPRRGD